MDMEKYNKAMKPGYWERWNDDEQARIDADIEANRKADGSFAIDGVAAGTEVRATQISHEFIFGAHIFNFNQLGAHELNERYKALYGRLFNSATIAFYWQPFEPAEGKRRFAAEERDTEEFWNSCENPKMQPHWRRPAADPVVEFCEKKGIRRHGHPLIWSSAVWQYPKFVLDKLPKEVLIDFLTDVRCGANIAMQGDALAERYPEFIEYMNAKFDERITAMAEHYGDRINSWDIVNESAYEITAGRIRPNAKVCIGYNCRPLPADYTFRAFQVAQKAFPPNVKLNINDWHLHENYLKQVGDLRSRGCKIDIMGAQMHLFDPQACTDIADGISDTQSPASVRKTMAMLSEAGLPIHLSEITITAPNNDERGKALQAVIARNLYRLWFSLKPMMGITWWNVVDDCGAPGEPSVSGLYTRKMEPKPAGTVLDDLINHAWKTDVRVKAEAKGIVKFRGFRGKYRLSWKGEDGSERSTEVVLH